MMGNEAMYMLMEGIASAEDIDTALRARASTTRWVRSSSAISLAGTPALPSCSTCTQTLGEKFRPCPLILKLVKAGRFGRKAGKGIYEYRRRQTRSRLGFEFSLMREVVIVGAVRTPVGRFRGALSDVRADHLGAIVLQSLIARAGIEPAAVDDVIFGCVTQVGEQCGNIARTALLSAGWPPAIPGMTVDRKCGSAEAAVHAGYNAIAAGTCDVVVAGGAESMTRVPMGGNRDVHGKPFGWKLLEQFEQVSQGEAAERVADRWNITRSDLDEFALSSHQRAATAADSGYFAREITPVPVRALARTGSCGGATGSSSRTKPSAAIRRSRSSATLKTSFRADGRVTAGNSSQISDGAAALLLMARTMRPARCGTRAAGTDPRRRDGRLGSDADADRSDCRDAQGARRARV